MENKKPLHKPKDGCCAWNEHVLCSGYSADIWRYCDDIPPRCCRCGWNPAVAAERSIRIREEIEHGKTA